MEIESLANILWDCHHMGQIVEESDCIFVLGSHDIRVAETGAQLFLKGLAPLIIFSGGLGRLTLGLWEKPEAEKFAEVAIKMGVPKNKIIIENRSTNTGENIIFTKQILEDNKIKADNFIVVQKPYMERRAYATFMKLWPEKKVIVTSPQVSFKEYCNYYNSGTITKDAVISIMVGDLQRIKVYPQKGFQIEQFIPEEVWSAYEKLIELGYTEHLILQ